MTQPDPTEEQMEQIVEEDPEMETGRALLDCRFCEVPSGEFHAEGCLMLANVVWRGSAAASVPGAAQEGRVEVRLSSDARNTLSKHERREGFGRVACDTCFRDWPCWPAQALAEVEALTSQLEEARQQADPFQRQVQTQMREIEALSSKLHEATAQLQAANESVAKARELRGSLEYAVDTLLKFEEEVCECEECEECGKMPADCTGTDCAKTCQCNDCCFCHLRFSLADAAKALGRAETEPRADKLRRLMLADEDFMADVQQGYEEHLRNEGVTIEEYAAARYGKEATP